MCESDPIVTEARRALRICNVCGYCNGFCDVFDAARRRPRLGDIDVAHLANLCHACRNCLYACQYAAPHPFAVNIPRTLASARQRSYLDYAWPRAFAGLLEHSVLAVCLIGLGAVGLMLALALSRAPLDRLFSAQVGSGAFYRVIPWGDMVLIGLIPMGWALLALGIGLRRYWRATRVPGVPVTVGLLGAALRDLLMLRNLRGGGPGCNDLDERPSQARRRLHQVLLTGLLLSFAATVVATLYHHLLGWEAPYPLLSAPVLLGTSGGIALSAAALGLLWLKWRGDRMPASPQSRAADQAALWLLLSVSLTGLLLLICRETAAMGILLLIHLGSVLTLFILLPYSKLVHGGYRSIALLIEAAERSRDAASPPDD